jgi:predicted Fe-Mo cluster-binding NifX family protein
MIAGKGVEVVLTGNCGPNAYEVLSAAGIKVVTGVAGKVQDAVQGYKSGKFQSSSQPNVPGHFGMGRGRGMG